MITFTVTGEPVAWARARAQKRGRKLHFFTDTDVAAHKQRVQAAARAAFPVMLKVPCVLEVEFYREKWPALKKWDVDNLVKLIMDSGNGVLWQDDALIVELVARKVVGEPRTVVRVRAV